MKNTIKVKIALISLSMFLAILVVITYYTLEFINNSRNLLIDSCGNTISFYKQRINTRIMRINDNVEDLAYIGLIYKATKNFNIANKIITDNIDSSKIANLGGGIWFEPYMFEPDKKLCSIYIYKDENDNIMIDKTSYDYQQRIWYKQLINKLKKERGIVWSTPYYDHFQKDKLVITAGAGIYDRHGRLLGLSSIDWQVSELQKYIDMLKPTENSFILVGDKTSNCIIFSTDKYLNNENLTGKSIANVPWFNPAKGEVSEFRYHDVDYISYMKELDNGMFFVTNVPQHELFRKDAVKLLTLFAMLIIISTILTILLYIFLQKNILMPINKLTEIANKIGEGKTAIDIHIDKPEEFAHLSDTFNNMAKNIEAISVEKEHINSELSIAKAIQLSSLPDFSKNKDSYKNFDIYASMQPAKEVGGDFYDGYFIDKDNYMFLIADVSGKGIPAALFMMTVKTLISNLSEIGYKPDILFRSINKKLCQNNKQGFFVTLLASIVNLKTGIITFINCGHNQPLLKRNGRFEYLNFEPNLVLGAFEDFDFQTTELKLQKDDIIFAYTDGITEAFGENGEMYGETRLQDFLNNLETNDLETLSSELKNNVKEYMGKAPQSDDITMISFKYTPTDEETNDTRYFNEPAVTDNYKKFYNWLHENCDKWNISDELKNKLDMCSEELYANITFYAYPNEPGNIYVEMTKSENDISLEFQDNGQPYNPLEKEDPDITLSAEERQLGGLGIYMVKNMADEVVYKFSDNKNILTLSFKI